MSRSVARRVARVAAALALLALPAAAHAQPQDLDPNNGPQFFLFGGLGPITFPADGFALTVGGPTTLRVVGLGLTGNIFQVFLNGSLAFTTAPLIASPDGTDTGALDLDAALADGRLSRGSVDLAAGTYTIGITVSGTSGFDGQGVIDANDASVVPEPAAVLTLGAGLAVLAGGAWRRRAA